LIGALVLAGCAPSAVGPDPELVGTLEAFLAAADRGEPVDGLVSPDFVLAAPQRSASGAEVDVLLAELAPLALRSAVDGHHEVLRAWVSQGDELSWLFAAADSEGQLAWVALFPPPPDGEDSSAPVAAYMEAWNTRDLDERGALLEEGWAADGRYVDPTGEAEGREALSALIEDFRDGLPGARVVARSDMAEHHDFVHFRWQARGLVGTIRAQGMDVGRLDTDGRMTFVGGFFGALDPED
jgi:hypothetical protein